MAITTKKKTTAKKAPATRAKTTNEEKPSLISVDKEKYTKTKSASGKASLHNGDEVAVLMDGIELDKAYYAAAGFLGVTAKSLREKYGHLNQGMQRMNLGNRIRGRVKNLNDDGHNATKELKAAFK